MRRLSMAATLSTAALVAGCGGGHRVHHAPASARQVAAGPFRVMHFALADDPTTPVVAEVPNQPIAYTPTSVPGVTLELFTLRRATPNAVLAVFALQNSATAASANQYATILPGLSANGLSSATTVSGVSLLDQTGLKEYQTFMADPSKDTTCLCSETDGGQTGSAGTHYYAALLAAPPTTVTTVSFVTGLGTIPNVPLSG